VKAGRVFYKLYYQGQLFYSLSLRIAGKNSDIFSIILLLIETNSSSPIVCSWFLSFTLIPIVLSLFLGSNFHSVVYPVDQNSEFNFIGILRKKLTNNQLQNYSLFSKNSFISSILSELSSQIDKNILGNINNIKCFPIFISNEVYDQQHKNIFLIGDAFFAFPPSFAQGASQSIEAAFELFEYINKNSNDFNKRRIKKTKMINNRSKFNHFVFHLSNPLIIFVRDFILRNLVKNKKFLENYLGKIYKN